MIDKRELILLRLQALLATVPGIKPPVHRDRGHLKGLELPALLLYDGREERVTKVPSGIVAVPAGVFMLIPQLFLVLRPRDNLQNLKLDNRDAPVGPELSAFRIDVIRIVTTDDTLLALVGANGQVEYRGCFTDMETGAPMLGEMRFDFAFNYVLDPRAL